MRQWMVFRKRLRKKRMKSTESIITMSSVAIEKRSRRFHAIMDVPIRMEMVSLTIVRNVLTGRQLKRFPASMSWRS